MRKVCSILAVALILSILPETAAQGRGQGRGRGGRGGAVTQPDSGPRGTLTDEERNSIREWFSNEANLANLPPGLARRETLPPGLQRQLQRNGTLPPGLLERLQPLPADLEETLPPVPEGRRRVVLGGNVIVLDEQTQQIVDLIVDLF